MRNLEKDTLEMRAVYASTMAELIQENPLIIDLEADLMSSMSMDKVQKLYPKHVINCGIMEAHSIGLAAGMSIAGHIPFFHTFTAFASRRCLDQLFMSVDYQQNNVKVIASDAGITSAHNGGTHMSFEDMGIVRGLASTVVMEMTDAAMMESIVRQLASLKGFYWVRTIRKQATKIYSDNEEFVIGKAKVLQQGKDVTLIANGIMVAEALRAADILAEQHQISAAVIDMFTLKPIDTETIVKFAQKTGKVVTCENHSIENGLGSAVAEVLVEYCPVPMRRVGIKQRYGQVGTVDFLQKEYQLTAEDIVKQALSMF
ncbi:transketolase [Gallibacterium genomosp. 2]|uniref:Transketolase n=1 Tax=Gallibacterium genomosp. 2 TaxID=155517 RepID=A0A0A2XGT9_9PAST|nr:transketolase family protein [Gallibacterium genomosp. 2]KGQ29870.1 transketolase [Gallibacterium genomosp. 2]